MLCSSHLCKMTAISCLRFYSSAFAGMKVKELICHRCNNKTALTPFQAEVDATDYGARHRK